MELRNRDELGKARNDTLEIMETDYPWTYLFRRFQVLPSITLLQQRGTASGRSLAAFPRLLPRLISVNSNSIYPVLASTQLKTASTFCILP